MLRVDSRTSARTLAVHPPREAADSLRRWTPPAAAGCTRRCTAAERRCATLSRRCALRWPIVARRCAVLVARKRAGRATLRATSCAAVRFFSCGGRRPAAAPAMLRRCRDGWSDFS
ncbi:hypothetical protein F511_45302 [Dorcoceras hygrometricum]|uniref:Uncharacterized protein n=1 Tax=Dorcoceras hygrometricum TaxID=472368 RepID=A0A2Z6ZWC3_9LAMI|nr:hypothetical protein F511_45302 [Dorcoceras hygrometricum]